MKKFVPGTVVAKKCWTDRLFSLQVRADVMPFKAGQFTQLALDIDGDIVGHPYSFVNAPNKQTLEFYFIKVPDGILTERLAKLNVGDAILLLPHASGFLCLSEVPEAKYLWLFSTGTGIGPFLSILNTKEPWQRFDRVILVHAVRYENELTYSDTIGKLLQMYDKQFHFVPFVTRDETKFAMKIRIPEAITNGQLESRVNIDLTPENSQVMLCGNPNMVHDTIEVLQAKGLKKNKRQEQGHITVENYW